MSVHPGGVRGGAVQSPDRYEPTQADVDLLWAGASIRPDLDAVRRAARDANIPSVLEAAVHHRVAPLVLRALGAAGVFVDRTEADAAAEGRAWEAHARLALPNAAKASLGPLTAGGFEPVLLKGLALVDRYPALGLRPMDDIDLLLPAGQTVDAAKVLEAAGWRRAKHLGEHDPGYDLVFAHPSVPGVPLELHFELTEWRERPRALEGRALWEARVPTTALGSPGWTLPAELELVVLVTHAAKAFHLFSRLIWIVDLAVVIGSTALDWDEVARLATRANRRVAAAVALCQARRLGAQVPDVLTTLPSALARSLTFRDAFSPEADFMPTKKKHWLSYLLIDDAPGKVRLAIADLIRPPFDSNRRRVARDLGGLVARGARSMLHARP